MTTRAAPNLRPFADRLRRLDDAEIIQTIDTPERRQWRVEANSKGAQAHFVDAFFIDPTGWIVEKCDCDAFHHIKESRGCVHCERIRILLGTSTMTDIQPYAPGKHMIKVQGGRDYLTAAGRIQWFRQEHPLGCIKIMPHVIEIEKKYAIFHAEVYDGEGRLLASDYKYEDAKGFADYIEKSATGAAARALGKAGYGTDDVEDGGTYEANVRPADAPVQRNGNASRPVVQDYPVMNAEEAAEFTVVKKRIMQKKNALDKDKWANYFTRAIGKWESKTLEYIKDVEAEVDKQVALLVPPDAAPAVVGGGEEDPFAE